MSGRWPGTGDVRLCRTGMLHRRGDTIPGPRQGPPIVPLPRNGLASSAAGGASPISPIFFGLRPKETAAPGQKKTAWAQNGAMRLICLKYGGPARDLGGRGRIKRWARSSQSPYLSLAAYAKSSLIPMLVLSPRKPLRWVFVGAPKLSAFSHANRNCLVGQKPQGPAANVAAAGLERRGSGSRACC